MLFMAPVDYNALNVGRTLRTDFVFEPEEPLTPPCGVCEYDTAIPKEQTVQDANCQQNTPRRKETFRCERYQCSNGFCYQRIHEGWDWFCTNLTFGTDCPSSSCIKL